MLNDQTQATNELRRFDPKQYLFDQGVKTLMDRGGGNERSVRSHIGKWLKQTGNDVYAVMEALEKAQDVAEPFSYMEAMLKGEKKVEFANPFLRAIACEIGDAETESWFKDCQIQLGDTVRIVTRNGFIRDRLKAKYMDVMKRAARGKPVEVL